MENPVSKTSTTRQGFLSFRSGHWLVIIVLVTALLLCVSVCLANDIPANWATMSKIEKLQWEKQMDPGIFWFGAWAEMSFCFCFTLVVEYLVVLLFLGWKSVSKGSLFGWILLVNLLTNPVAQCLVIKWGAPGPSGSLTKFWLVTGLVELVVVAVEFLLLMQAFNQMRDNWSLSRKVTAREALAMAVVANAASFFLGLAASHVILLPEYLIPVM